ncbi:MAG TPA: acyl-ACP thioesterase domain-containing protein [Candidatus Limnocylindrales bacterium]|nr:acyl-ACP thioesterase domain-containing protein [Candidatus Limnocylindrales bacterium]
MTDAEPDRCSAPYHVRFDEGGPDGLIRLSVLLRYTQDLAGHHSAARGYGRDWYAERGITWLVRTAEVAIVAPIAVGDELLGTTQVVGWRRVWARRRTDFHDPAGALVAQVQIDWVLLDARGAPTRIPAEFDRVFGAPAATFGLARVDLGEASGEVTTTTFRVRPQELDPMDHVNNAVYADWLDEAVLGVGGAAAVRMVPRLVRLEYARAAEPMATIVAETWQDGEAWSCRIAQPDGVDLLRARLELLPPTEHVEGQAGSRPPGT